jgi:hypothetical protein
MLNRIIHPSPDHVRWTGLAAMIGGALGLVFAPLYSLAYFASSDGAADPPSALTQAWADPARDLLDPLLTFASPDVVRLTYFKLFLFITIGMLAGVIGLHASQAERGGRLERWGFRVSFAGLFLLTIGALGGYWPSLLNFTFVAFIVPGLFLVVLGSPLFGLGSWRAGVAPRAGALLLTIGGPAMLLINQIATLGSSLILLYLAWVILGYWLWSATKKPSLPIPPQSDRAEHIDNGQDTRPGESRH